MPIGHIAVARWFKDGEGYAYDPYFKDKLMPLLEATGKVTQARLEDVEDKLHHVQKPHGHYYMVRSKDTACEDRLAANRGPTQTIVVRFDQTIPLQMEEQLRETLETLPLPADRGTLKSAQIVIASGKVEAKTDYPVKPGHSNRSFP